MYTPRTFGEINNALINYKIQSNLCELFKDTRILCLFSNKGIKFPIHVATKLYTSNPNRYFNTTHPVIINFSSLFSHKDAPEVNLQVPEAVEGQNASLVCVADGVPTSYQFGRWKQTFGSSLIRSNFINDDNVVVKSSILFFKNLSYQDRGTYSCEVQNGVIGSNGGLIQTGSAMFDIKGYEILTTKIKVGFQYMLKFH